MATITLRSTKGSTLTHTEVDDNFSNINNEKIQTSAAHAANDYAKFSTAANTVVGRSYTEVKTDLSLNNVENTAVSTWAGSTNITTLGTITTGTWQGTAIADAYISSATTWNAKQGALTFGIADTNSVVINSASVADNDYAKFTASGLEGRSTAEVKTDLAITSSDISDVAAFSQSGTYASLRAQATTKGDVGLGNVENTTLSTWAGSTNITTLGTITSGTWTATDVAVAHGGTGASDASTARTNLGLAIGTNVQAYNATLAAVAGGTYTGDDSITTVGTIGTGTWQGSVIASAYLDADTAHLSGAQTFGGAKTFNGGIVLTSTGATTPAITFNTNTGSDAGVDMAIRASGEGLDFYEPEDANKVHMRIVDDTGVNAVYGLRTGLGDGTLRIDSSGNSTLTTCGANAFQEALTATTGGTYAVSCNTGVHWRTLNAPCTISFIDTPASNTSRTITLILQQDATGGRVVTWPATNWYWAENVEPPFDTAANAKNVVTVMVVNNGGTLHYYASLGIRNAS